MSNQFKNIIEVEINYPDGELTFDSKPQFILIVNGERNIVSQHTLNGIVGALTEASEMIPAKRKKRKPQGIRNAKVAKTYSMPRWLWWAFAITSVTDSVILVLHLLKHYS